jgi:hypothetical protein
VLPISAGVVTIARAPIVQQRTSLHSAPTRVRVRVPRMRLSKYSSTLSCMAFSALQLDAMYCARFPWRPIMQKNTCAVLTSQRQNTRSALESSIFNHSYALSVKKQIIFTLVYMGKDVRWIRMQERGGARDGFFGAGPSMFNGESRPIIS